MLRLEPPYTGVSRASGPEIPKKSQKGVPRGPGPECQKSVEKVPNDPKKSQKDYKISVRGLFRHFFATPGRDPWERLFETFWGISGLGGVETPVYGDCNRKSCETTPMTVLRHPRFVFEKSHRLATNFNQALCCRF